MHTRPRGVLRWWVGSGVLALVAGLAAPVLAAGSDTRFGDELAMNGLDCSIFPARSVELASDLNGVVDSVEVVPGQRVEKGDLIAKLDTDLLVAEWKFYQARAEAKGAIALATEQLKTAEAKYQSAEKALKSNVISRVQYEEALGEYRAAQSRVTSEKEAQAIARAEAQRAKLTVAKGEIRAPVAGVVGEELIAPGESTFERPVAHIVQVNPMRVEVFIPLERSRTLLSRDAYEIAAGPGFAERLTVAFDYVSPLADQSSRTIKAYFKLETDAVAPGMQCVFITGSGDAAMAAPDRN
ncbi:MAG: efflux RND transporter periplasmic adaptor subunit [Minwuia sp.]|uniref:efflux RND transporter periplasmic adaptor subunit n=1 Tax=Minwuia sp. TaxID=2493630 RepID=UPI003A873425